MMQIKMTKQVPVEAKILSIHMKVVDQFSCEIQDQHGEALTDYEGYVPGFMPGEHYGDYLMLDIDLDSGQIVNWKKPSAEEIEAFINREED